MNYHVYQELENELFATKYHHPSCYYHHRSYFEKVNIPNTETNFISNILPYAQKTQTAKHDINKLEKTHKSAIIPCDYR